MRRLGAVALAVLALLVAGCGGGPMHHGSPRQSERQAEFQRIYQRLITETKGCPPSVCASLAREQAWGIVKLHEHEAELRALEAEGGR